MRNVLVYLFCIAVLIGCNKPKPEEKKEEVAEVKPAGPFEIADAKYISLGKQGISQLSSGDVNAWMNNFADDAVYRWSSGDSLKGKEAISKYWTDRRKNVIDSINFDNDVWIPIKVNQHENGPRQGNWILSWYRTNVKYKNGKKLSFSVQTTTHFNDADKIDYVIQYLDRAPINAALASKGKK